MTSPDDRGDAAALPQREQALELLHEYTRKPGLIKHALAVEAAMRAYARALGGAEEAWGLVGLLHDFDYERWPSMDDHPFRGCEILEQRNYPPWFRRAILSHAAYSGVVRETPLERALFACDELCGFLTACALVTSGKSLREVQLGSVRRKLKSRAFAASVNRDDIHAGAEALGRELDEHIEFVLAAMGSIAEELGLDGIGKIGV